VTKTELFNAGKARMTEWCVANAVPVPTVLETEEPTDYDTCAFYRSNTIYIWVPACAAIGHAGMAWSYPGYVVDRTPYGVLLHELGHHVEKAHGARGGIVAASWLHQTGEKPITSYAPNPNEWFAEIFRLWVANPDLLRKIRPKVAALLDARWKTVEPRSFEEVLAKVPRQLQAARNKILAATRPAVLKTRPLF